MSEALVPAVKTPATPAEVYAALRDASRLLLGAELPRDALLVLLSQWGEETGRGASAWCWNLGNQKHVLGDGRSYYQVRCNEIIGGKEVWFDPPHPATSFRAYESLDAGARDYLLLLHSRFAVAWPAVLAGSPLDFARLLKSAHYFTADLVLYQSALVSLFTEFDRTIPVDAAPEPLAVAPLVDVGVPAPPDDVA